MKRYTQAVLVAAVVSASALTFSVVGALAHSAHLSATTIHIRGGEFFFKPNVVSAPRGTIVFTFTNVGHVGHDVKIAGKRTPIIQPGKTAKLVLRLTRRGNYPFICSVPGHAQAGMHGVLKVR